MPTYEFRCPDGTIVEKIFKMSEVPDSIPNPNGEGEAVRIISGGAALVFKGSGFYITDYGKDGKKDQRSGAGESSSSISTAKSESKSDSSGSASSASTSSSSNKSDS
ncbi:MAG: FmdB family zinc ribbon protein [Gemmatimonas sp.]